jgi:hypothetical protein
VLLVDGGSEQGFEFGGTEDLGQAAGRASGGQSEGDVRAVEGLRVEEGKPRGNGIDGVPLQAAFGHEVEQVVLDLVGGELIGGAAEVLGEADDRFQIGLLCGRGEAA